MKLLPNPNGAKGALFETDVVKFLVADGHKARKPRQTGNKDVGDIWLEKDIILQAKAWQNLSSGMVAGVKGAEVQAKQARREFGVAIVKKPRGRIADAYVIMPLHVFIRFLRRQPPA